VGTFGIFSASQANGIEQLFGLNYIGSASTYYPGSQQWDWDPSSTLFNKLPNPFTATSYPGK
jgi:hypothetical protein